MPIQIVLKGEGPFSLFLDRDGVLNERIVNGYVSKPSELIIFKGVPETIVGFAPFFSRIIVVTNQSGIGKGLMSETDFSDVTAAMQSVFSSHNARVDAFFHCPHRPDALCECRKPNKGMALQAKEMFPEITFDKSVMVGDSQTDMQFGKSLGMVCIQIGGDSQFPESDYRVKELNEISFCLP